MRIFRLKPEATKAGDQLIFRLKREATRVV
jgi:hypothetical protein